MVRSSPTIPPTKAVTITSKKNCLQFDLNPSVTSFATILIYMENSSLSLGKKSGSLLIDPKDMLFMFLFVNMHLNLLIISPRFVADQ